LETRYSSYPPTDYERLKYLETVLAGLSQIPLHQFWIRLPPRFMHQGAQAIGSQVIINKPLHFLACWHELSLNSHLLSIHVQKEMNITGLCLILSLTFGIFGSMIK
jgi:hypothetical protein